LLKRQTQVESDDEGSDEDRIAEELLENPGEAIEKLRREVKGEEDEETEEKGLFSMKFMKNAEKKKIDRHQQMLDELEEELEGEKQIETSGRMKFQAKPESRAFEEALESSEEEEVQNNKLIKVQQPTKKRKTMEIENPWLEKIEENEKRKTKHQKKSNEDDESEAKIITKESSDESSQDEEEETKEDDVFKNKMKKEAFAGDDLDLEFKIAKQKAIDEEINLPDLDTKIQVGWGTWTGKGTNSTLKVKRMNEKMEEVKEELRESKREERKDSNLSNVIIRSTAALPSQYLADTKDFKFDYEKRIYDNQVAHPLGLEWNTVSEFPFFLILLPSIWDIKQ
jgi:U3 small nucleolar RNA-associated protein 14